jgi:hypothetical protein
MPAQKSKTDDSLAEVYSTIFIQLKMKLFSAVVALAAIAAVQAECRESGGREGGRRLCH